VRRRRFAAALSVLTAVAAAGPAGAQMQRPPGPPPLAFRSVTLERAAGRVDVRMQAMEDVGVRVSLRRHGVRFARHPGFVAKGQSVVGVPLGPRSRRHLRPGQHVDIAIEYGGPLPIVVHDAVLHRSARHPHPAPPGSDLTA
jgi:hypothetical protein